MGGGDDTPHGILDMIDLAVSGMHRVIFSKLRASCKHFVTGFWHLRLVRQEYHLAAHA